MLADDRRGLLVLRLIGATLRLVQLRLVVDPDVVGVTLVGRRIHRVVGVGQLFGIGVIDHCRIGFAIGLGQHGTGQVICLHVLTGRAVALHRAGLGLLSATFCALAPVCHELPFIDVEGRPGGRP